MKTKEILILILSVAIIAVVLIVGVFLIRKANGKNRDADLFEYEEFSDGTIGIIDYKGDKKDITIPVKIDGKKVSKLVSLYAGSSLDSLIDDFISAKDTLPCSKIESITIPADIENIEPSAFVYSEKLEEFKVDKGNDNYCSADGVLYSKDKTVLVCVPQGKKPASFTVSESVKEIGEAAFYNIYSISEITLPDKLESIGTNAFFYCTSLKSIDLPQSLTTISSYAFIGCKELEGIEIPKSVTEIGSNAFSSCDNIVNVTVQQGNERYYTEDNVLFDKTESALMFYCRNKQDKEYTVPDGIKLIADEAFAYSRNLENIIIPDSVEKIGHFSFEWCSNLKDITIPQSVTEIKSTALSGCDNVTIHCTENSEAHKYAQENNINFILQ